jgi:hypothetical protein
MEAYSGVEPHVGEITAVRTFRIGPGGVLYPLFSDLPWLAGTNTAICRVTAASDEPGHDEHLAPEPGCTCGYYAYATDEAAQEYPNSRHVVAIIACWGHVIAGTRGLRAQHARVEAIWMSDTVPSDLADEVRAHYPGLASYTDKAEMLAAHPPTVLDCYEFEAPRERALKRLGLRLATLAALVLGVLPLRWQEHNLDLRWLWITVTAFFVLGFVVLQRRRTDLAARLLSVVFAAIVMWLAAPYAGAAGTLLLRVPLIQMTAITIFQRRLLAREANRFPALIGQPNY